MSHAECGFASFVGNLRPTDDSVAVVVFSADDAAGAEKMDKLKRQYTLESAMGRQASRDWDPFKL